VFNKEGLFYRNNFSDDRIVPEIKPRYQTVDTGIALDINYKKTDTFLDSLVNGITKGSGKLISLNNKYSFMNEADKDFLKMKRYQYVSGLFKGNPATIVVDITTGKPISSSEFKELSNEGKVSKNEMVGYKKVKSDDGVPLTIQRKVGKSLDEFSVFKMVNLYGSTRIVNEYPSLMTPSPLDNNTFKVKEELTDNAIIAMLAGEPIPADTTFADEQSLASEVLEEAPIVEEEVVEPTENKADIETAFQDGTLRISIYNNNKYFVLSDNRILESEGDNFGKEVEVSPEVAEEILDKAVLYKPKC
jgi:hypothetical protein